MISVLLAAALTIAQSSPPRRTEQPLVKNAVTDSKGKAGKEKAREQSPNPVTTHAIVNQVNTASQPTQSKQETKPPVYSVNVVSQPRDPWYVAYVLITIGATLVNIGIFIAVWKQGRWMKVSAEAARDNAMALMNAEQGRIITFWERLIHLGGEPNTGVLKHALLWHAKNVGKSEVQITKLWARFISIDSIDSLPPQPNYRGRVGTITYQSEPLHVDGTTVQFLTSLETTLDYDDMEKMHREKKCILYAYGRVCYLDIFQRKHEARFGIRYESGPTFSMQSPDADIWVVDGPQAYNKSK